MTTSHRYRWRTLTRKGRWTDSDAGAREAAVKAKVASKDEATGQIYLDVFTSIERDPA